MSDKRDPKPGWLRAGLALLSLILGILLICLWARSQTGIDELQVGFRTDHVIWLHTRPDGLRIHFRELRDQQALAWRWRFTAPDEQTFRNPIFPWEWNKQLAGFGYSGDRGGWALAIPYWFLTLACAVAAALLAPMSRWHFSLRRLLAIVTFVAVLLGIVVILSTRRH